MIFQFEIIQGISKNFSMYLAAIDLAQSEGYQTIDELLSHTN